MNTLRKYYDVIVIGGGHAGIEASSASARKGCSTALITMDKSTIGRLSCNPAIGGMAKGQLVREIDALGGEMALLADKSGVQFKMLGTSKGPAMWSPRSQNDKDLYPYFAQKRLKEIDNLEVLEGIVDDVIVEKGTVKGIIFSDKDNNKHQLETKGVILCAGTFLCGVMHTGEYQSCGGRVGEKSSDFISGSLSKVGFETGRLKTGTPPRIDKNSIDFGRCRTDPGDEHPKPFSYRTQKVENKISCFVTYTSEKTHEILRSGFDRSPMFSGKIKGVGPRYCPSIEDKIFRFSDKDSHHIFLEPEGLNTESVYVNGFSTSLPQDIQIAGLRSIEGLGKCEIIRWGYAVEYDYFPPYQLNRTLESKYIQGLYFAGQVNGTSGYEEAAAQGLIAGINCAAKIKNEPEFILNRSNSYIGVLLDDLSVLSTDEPYRMFTSRAEYRLILRRDNADIRLSELGYSCGLVDAKVRNNVVDKIEAIKKVENYLKNANFTFEGELERIKGWQYLKRPNVNTNLFVNHPEINPEIKELLLNEELSEQVDINAKYEGYIIKHEEEIERFKSMEAALIPTSLDYSKIKSLSSEGREKLEKVKPISFGQASRISGVSRSDLSVLMIYIK